MKHLKSYAIFESKFESSVNDMDEYLKNAKDILLDFEDKGIPVECDVVISSVDHKKIPIISIGNDDPKQPFELDDDLIESFRSMNEYFESEGFRCKDIYFLKLVTTESGLFQPESETLHKIEDFLKFVMDNKNIHSQMVKTLGKWKNLANKMKYTLIEVTYEKL